MFCRNCNEVYFFRNYQAVSIDAVKDPAAMLPLLSDLFRVRVYRCSEVRGGQGRLFDIMENFSVQSVREKRVRSRSREILLSPRKVYRVKEGYRGRFWSVGRRGEIALGYKFCVEQKFRQRCCRKRGSVRYPISVYSGRYAAGLYSVFYLQVYLL